MTTKVHIRVANWKTGKTIRKTLAFSVPPDTNSLSDAAELEVEYQTDEMLKTVGWDDGIWATFREGISGTIAADADEDFARYIELYREWKERLNEKVELKGATYDYEDENRIL